MRIVIDAHQLSPHITGTDRLARNVLRELADLDTENAYRIIVNPRVDTVPEHLPGRGSELLPIAIRRRTSWLLAGLPRLLSRLRADVFFSFHNLAAPAIRRCHTVVSVLDLIPFVYQSTYYAGWRSYWLRRPLVLGAMRRSIAVADRLLAISEFTKRALVERFAVAPGAVSVAHLQADPRFQLQRTAAELAAIRRRYGLAPDFVFALGGTEPRKNVATLVRAHRLLPTELRQRFPLCVGGAAWPGIPASGSADPWVRFIGFIDEEDLPGVYQAAPLFAFPSAYEGFGLPVLEAMAAGAPVLASNATSLPEVAGDAAVLVAPFDADAMSEGLRSLLLDPARRSALVAAGRRRLASFSWRTFAETLKRLLTDGQGRAAAP